MKRRENIYGMPLDKNGYSESIVQLNTDEACFICGRCDRKLDRHEIFGGAYRKKSKAFGLWVSLCHTPCHILSLESVHKNVENNYKLRRIGQRRAMEEFNWDTAEFREMFGKNYLGDET